MFFKRFSLILIGCFIISTSFAQQNYTISGFVKDSSNGESLLGAIVYLKEIAKGTTTNQYGFYSLTVPQGNYTLIVSSISFQERQFSITLNHDVKQNVDMLSAAIETGEVVVTGEQKDKNIKSTAMGQDELDIEQIKKLPAFLGEVDILKSIQLLPGVQSAGEGNTGFYVRGGGIDQNLILLDEATVYNVSHLFGFFSVFNGDAVQNVTLYKGGMPAQYGGRLASVLDVQMKEGNDKEYHGEGGLGLIASRFTVEGPIKKDTSSFIVSARRTFIDLFLQKPFLKNGSDIEGNIYYFYDLNAKINYRLSDRDRLFVSGYFGRDVFTYKSPDSNFNIDVRWGNATATARWNHLFSDKLFMNTSLIYTNYNFQFDGQQDNFDFKLFSGITDYNLKSDFTWLPNILHSVKFGLDYIYHIFTPSNASATEGNIDFDFGNIIRNYAHEGALYINDDWDINDKIRLSGGARYSLFDQVGPFTRYVIDPTTGKTTDTLNYSAGQSVKVYSNIEPRFSIRYELNGASSIKASYTQNYQYVQLASLSGISLPTDLWIPSTDKVKPQFGTQYALGYFRNLKDNVYETSVEVYYKEMKNQIEYAAGFQPENNVNNNVDNNFVFGQGWSYGSEFFIKKAKGRFSGWIGYTLAWTKRNFPDLNDGETYYARHDRRHDVSVVLTYELSKRWTLGATWVYATGDLNTIPLSIYFINGRVVYDYGNTINNFRLPAYHRLDISATLNSKKKPGRKYEHSWNFSIFNVYNRANPYLIYFDDVSNYNKGIISVQAKQISLFPILPSVTYNFKF